MIVVESTGGLEKPLIKALQKVTLPVAMVHPGRVRKFAAGIGWIAKTDRLDARLLAWYGFAAQPKARPKPEPACEILSELVRRRGQVVEMLTAERNRRSTCPISLADTLEEHIAWLTAERDRLTAQIKTMLATQPEFHDKDVVLQSVKALDPSLVQLYRVISQSWASIRINKLLHWSASHPSIKTAVAFGVNDGSKEVVLACAPRSTWRLYLLLNTIQ